MLSLLQFTILMFFYMALAKGDSQSDLETRSAQDSNSNSYDLRSARRDSSSSSYESRSARQDSRSYDSYENESRSSPCRDQSMDDDYLDCGGNEYYDQYYVNAPPHQRTPVPTPAITTTSKIGESTKVIVMEWLHLSFFVQIKFSSWPRLTLNMGS